MKKLRINKKSLKFGSYAFASTIVVLAIIVIFNALIGLDVVRNRVRFDITKNRIFSLSEESINILENLDKNVEIIILTEEKNYQYPEVTEILNQYNIKSNGKVTRRFVDIEKDPGFVERELDPEQVKGIKSGSIVVKCGGKNIVVSESDMIEYDYSYYGIPQVSGLKIEHAFTSAINNVTADFTPVAYFAQGHGEFGLDEQLKGLKATITANGYEVKELFLGNEVPEDASVIIFASPKTDLLADEMENLMKYLENGGHAIFLMDVQQTSSEMTNFNTVLGEYNLALNNDLIFEGDQLSYYQDFKIIIPTPLETEVTTKLDPAFLRLYMPSCRSVSVLQAEKDWVTVNPMLMTSERSIGRHILTGEEVRGPFILGAISENRSTGISRIALIGNAQFISDDWMNYSNDNGKRYIMSALNWMQDQDGSVYIPSKSLSSQPIQLTAQSRFISFISLSFLFPLVIIGFGIFVWIRRKNL
ncbi:MAG: GldG family protein [Clostridiaceae bacterium]|nr:GldG family protein [Clostridiaceae bacterium]